MDIITYYHPFVNSFFAKNSKYFLRYISNRCFIESYLKLRTVRHSISDLKAAVLGGNDIACKGKSDAVAVSGEFGGSIEAFKNMGKILFGDAVAAVGDKNFGVDAVF